jgi:hypothetical protein
MINAMALGKIATNRIDPRIEWGSSDFSNVFILLKIQQQQAMAGYL